MASVQYYAAASLDGYIARPDGSIDWLQQYGADADLGDGPMQDGSMDEFYAGVGSLVMGAATYEWVLEHASAWPYDLPTFVVTHRRLPQPQGGEVRFAKGNASAIHADATEAAGGKNVWFVGGGSLAADWAKHKLIDEIIVTVVPVYIGDGLPFFAGAIDGELRHANTKTHANGMVELRYTMPK
jgi:dihydrofolate reductase